MKCEYLLEKGSGELNEDALVVEGNLFGVFDGATSLDRRTFEDGKTGGLLASSEARAVFAKNHYPLVSLAGSANEAIGRRMIRNGVDRTRKEHLWSTSAAVIRIKGDCLEWVQTGDANIVLIFHDHSHRVLVDQDDHDYDTLCLWNHRPCFGLNGWEKTLADRIRKKRAEMNLSYGVLNGEEQASDFFRHGHETLDGVRDILLFTDGLSIPVRTPEKKKNFDALVNLYLDRGLTGTRNRIREIEAQDPCCALYPRFKQHDDIAAIALAELSCPLQSTRQ